MLKGEGNGKLEPSRWIETNPRTESRPVIGRRGRVRNSTAMQRSAAWKMLINCENSLENFRGRQIQNWYRSKLNWIELNWTELTAAVWKIGGITRRWKLPWAPNSNVKFTFSNWATTEPSMASTERESLWEKMSRKSEQNGRLSNLSRNEKQIQWKIR